MTVVSVHQINDVLILTKTDVIVQKWHDPVENQIKST